MYAGGYFFRGHSVVVSRCNGDVVQEYEQLQSQHQLVQMHCEDLEKTCAELGSQLSQ